jgi:hypothetical protein
MADGTYVLFEGIGTITVNEKPQNHPDFSKVELHEVTDYDVCVKVWAETLGNFIRWYGTIEALGELPKNLSGDYTLRLSDDRVGVVRVLGPFMDDRYQFQGQDLPPGFLNFVEPTDLVSVELTSSTPTWRVWLSRAFGLVSIVSIFAAVWVDSYRGELVYTGCISMLLALGFTPTRPKSLPEVPLDCPHQ